MSFEGTHTSLESLGSFAAVNNQKPEPLSDAVRDALVHYFDRLDGTAPNDLYQLVIRQVEQPLFETILNYTGGNQSRAASLLGISRSTLRKKIAQYEIE